MDDHTNTEPALYSSGATTTEHTGWWTVGALSPLTTRLPVELSAHVELGHPLPHLNSPFLSTALIGYALSCDLQALITNTHKSTALKLSMSLCNLSPRAPSPARAAREPLIDYLSRPDIFLELGYHGKGDRCSSCGE